MHLTVWHAGLWQVLRSCNIEGGLVQTIQALYENSSILLNNQLGEFFQTTAGVHQGYFLLPILFNLFIETIMQEILHDHHISISIGGRPLYNLHFAENISLMGGSNAELQDLINRLVT